MAAIMIDYATLCRAIEDWKAGHQPSAVTPAAAPQRITANAHEEEAVEYSGVYDASDAPVEQAPDSTVVYQLGEFDGEVEADAEDGEAETAEVEDSEEEEQR